MEEKKIARRQSESEARHRMKGRKKSPRRWSWPAIGGRNVGLALDVGDRRRDLEENIRKAKTNRQEAVASPHNPDSDVSAIFRRPLENVHVGLGLSSRLGLSSWDGLVR
jgi:hypothetical protein